MDIKKVCAQNILSYRDIELELNPGITIIFGKNNDSVVSNSNGAGKSALYDIIYYSLFNTPARDIKITNLFSYKTDYSKSEIWFNFKGDEFFISRERGSKGNKYQIYKNSELIGKTQPEIENILSTIISPYWFKLITYFSTNTINSITSLSDAELKLIFNKLLGIDFTNIRQRLYDFNSKLNTELSTLKYEISSLLEDIEHYKSQNYKEFKVDINQEAHIVDELNKCKAEREKFVSMINEIEKHNMALNTRISIINKQINNIIDKTVCPTCLRPLTEQDKVNLINNLKAEIETYQHQLRDPAEFNLELSQLDEKLKLLTQQLEEIKLAKAYLDKVQNTVVDTLLAKVQSLTERYELVNKDYLAYKFWYDSFGPTKIPLMYYYKFVDYLNEILLVIAQSITKSELLPRFDVDEKGKIQLMINDNIVFEQLSGGEQRRISFVVMIACRQLLSILTATEPNIIFIDECFDILDQVGVDLCMDLLTNLYKDKCIMIVSHNTELTEKIRANVLIVEKSNNVSSVYKQHS